MELILVFCILCTPMIALILYLAFQDAKNQKLVFQSETERLQRDANWRMAVHLYELARASKKAKHKSVADAFMMKHVWGIDNAALKEGVMKTDLEKAQMRIKFIKNDVRKICSSAHWTSERLKAADGNVPKYFIDQHGISAEAITEAYFVGRQAGRLDMAKDIMGVIGEGE